MEIGTFYEIHQIEDLGYAKKAADLLDIVLTRKNKSVPNSPYLAGVPSHTAEGYFKKLLELGERVVVVSQKVEHKNDKKIVSRRIEKILSPGVVVENIAEEKSNYFACLYEQFDSVGIALIDISTGEVKITETPLSNLNEYLTKVKPAEILLCGDLSVSEEKYKILRPNKKIEITKLQSAGAVLGNFYNIVGPTSDPTFSISVLGLERWKLGSLALSNLINFVASTEYNQNLLKKLSVPKIYNEIEYLTIPLNGYRSLEIFDSMNSPKDTLVYSLDNCKTAMGKRLLREWLNYPLLKVTDLNSRYDRVEKFIKTKETYSSLKDVYDIQRLSRRMLVARLMPHEILHFYESLRIIFDIFKKEKQSLSAEAKEIIKFLEMNIVFSKLDGIQLKEFEFFSGDLFEKVKEQFLNLNEAKTQAYALKQKYESIVSAKTGVAKHYFRLEKKRDSYKLTGAKGLYSNNDQISMVKKTTTIEVNTTEWKTTSDKWLFREMKYLQDSQIAWQEFQADLMDKFGDKINKIAHAISEIDVLVNFAKISMERDYSRPKLIEDSHAFFNFKTLRHPIVELSGVLREDFIPNDVELNGAKDIMCIYGANSAGKSTILKSVALNIIMAQVGCFVAAAPGSALTPFEAILTRMTTFDSLSEGLSTFTMEMKELQIALKFNKKKALFLLDEIGRGTSVEDGEAIAFATLEYLSQSKNNSVAFFATHYHNLAPNISKYSNILVKNMDCWLDEKMKLVFSRKLKDGPGTGSYGIDVAASCGLPIELIRVARNYNKKYAPIKKSRYNSKVEGILCPVCEENPVQETHHIIDQKQGKVKEVEIRGVKRHVHHKENLIMICASCHHKITQGEIKLIKE